MNFNQESIPIYYKTRPGQLLPPTARQLLLLRIRQSHRNPSAHLCCRKGRRELEHLCWAAPDGRCYSRQDPGYACLMSLPDAAAVTPALHSWRLSGVKKKGNGTRHSQASGKIHGHPQAEEGFSTTPQGEKGASCSCAGAGAARQSLSLTALARAPLISAACTLCPRSSKFLSFALRSWL